MKIAATIIRFIVTFALTVWASMALFYDAPVSPLLAKVLVGGFAVSSLFLFFGIRSTIRSLAFFSILFGAVIFWWLQIPPSNNRDWSPDVARPANVTVNGDIVTMENVRNFDYRSETDFTERWETRTYDLSKLTGVDLYMSYWGSPWMAHTIVSWEFEDGQHLAISIETRKRKGDVYSAIRGFFRQFELYFVVADERDVIRLRTNYRNEDVYLYRFNAPPGYARILLQSYIKEIDRLETHPEWYNAFTDNCTTAIRHRNQEAGTAKPWDWRLLVNGYLDQLLYERKNIDTSATFDVVRKRSNIVERAKVADKDLDFSKKDSDALDEGFGKWHSDGESGKVRRMGTNSNTLTKPPTDKPDIEKLMRELRDEVKRSAEARRIERSSKVSFTPAGAEGAGPLIERAELAYLNSHWGDWAVSEEIASHRKILGPIIVGFKRFLVKTLWQSLFKGYLERERQFNMHLIRYLNDSAKHTDKQDYDNFWQLNEKVDADIKTLNEKVDALFEALSGELIEIKSRRH